MRKKKDAKYLNVYIERKIFDDFDAFCNWLGQSKTVAAERALVMYMNSFKKEESKSGEKTDAAGNSMGKDKEQSK